MIYKLQRKKMIHKSTLNNSIWAVHKLQEERELEKCSKGKRKFLTIQGQIQQIQIKDWRT